ncbi:unnamed protein product [Vitrella brassicaformis CCMP3155]|uniref:Uncharacterized protein n=1 Tax=Vitrella brassicaformis (strain CCMP3155) TaxID=1169540 RepID=A0A0G4F3N8_VITBC|nr:unnamed protein product [Vitrella brassicaformis CCMP3155]|eukprot:CEM06445.1 unnamed protein product [Vitrella brassicaformis CCMP3155]
MLGILIAWLYVVTKDKVHEYLYVDTSLGGPEIASKLFSAQVAVLSQLALATVVLGPIIVYWWNKIPEATTIPRDRDLPSDVRVLENSWTKPAAGEEQKPLRLRDLSVRDSTCINLGIIVGSLLCGYFETLFEVANSSMGGGEVDGLTVFVQFALPTLIALPFVRFWWKQVAYDD